MFSKDLSLIGIFYMKRLVKSRVSNVQIDVLYKKLINFVKIFLNIYFKKVLNAIFILKRHKITLHSDNRVLEITNLGKQMIVDNYLWNTN